MNTNSALKTLDTVRIDKWLWAVRICKTRQVALDLCKREKVLVDGQRVKPSREIRAGQLVLIKKDGIEWLYGVLECIDKRVGAPLAAKCKEDKTPQESLDKLKLIKRLSFMPRREQGMGRPTKKERRELDKMKEGLLDEEE